MKLAIAIPGDNDRNGKDKTGNEKLDQATEDLKRKGGKTI